MGIYLFIILNFFAALVLVEFCFKMSKTNFEKIQKSRKLKIFIGILFTLGFIGNYFLSKYFLEL